MWKLDVMVLILDELKEYSLLIHTCVLFLVNTLFFIALMGTVQLSITLSTNACSLKKKEKKEVADCRCFGFDKLCSAFVQYCLFNILVHAEELILFSVT